MQKRGQFYLIASIVIIGILISLTVVYNSVRTTTEDVSVYDLSDEISYEGARVIDQGIFYDTEEQIQTNLETLAENYAKSNPDLDLLLVYGDGDAIQYTCDTTGSVELGDTSSGDFCSLNRDTLSITSTDADNIKVLFEGEEYTFRISSDQSFYIILAKDKGDDKIVATNEEQN